MPTVIVASPKLGAPMNSFMLPGNVTSYTDSPIYAPPQVICCTGILISEQT